MPDFVAEDLNFFWSTLAENEAPDGSLVKLAVRVTGRVNRGKESRGEKQKRGICFRISVSIPLVKTNLQP
jgi:hypothetical protein